MALVIVLLLHLYGLTIMMINAQRFTDYPILPQTTMISRLSFRDRRNKAEPSCDELRAMWRYSKRQSRAAEATNDLPMYRDPFSYNTWETYPIRSGSSLGYRDTDEKVRNRSGGRVPVYGKMIHKAPGEGRLRNGMPNRMKAFEEVARMYGTVNRQPPDPRRRHTFRVGGGSSMSQVPQAGSFQHLKELIRTERARELQDQRIAEEIAARAAALNEMGNNHRRNNEPEDSREHYLNSVQSYQKPKEVNYNFGQGQYVPSLTSFNDRLLRNEQYDRDSLMH